MSESLDRDLLISRAVDASATNQDWGAIQALSERDPAMWRDIVQAQRDHANLSRAVATELQITERVHLPENHASFVFQDRVRGVSKWLGWAAAAAVGLAWAGVGPVPVDQSGQSAGVPLASFIKTPRDALDLYLNKGAEAGRVIGEMPDRVLLDAKPTKDGNAMEVLYLRQILERATVDDAYRVGTDELGRPAAVKIGIRIRVSSPI